MRLFICLIFFIFTSTTSFSFGEKPVPVKEIEKTKSVSEKKQKSDQNSPVKKIEEIDKMLNSMGMKSMKQTMEEMNDEEDRRKKGAGCLKFINVVSKKKGLLRNLGLARNELYKARFRNHCDYGIEFKFEISFIDREDFVFETHSSKVKEIGKNTTDEVTEEVIFFPATDFKKIKKVQIKIVEEMLLRPSVPKNLVQ